MFPTEICLKSGSLRIPVFTLPDNEMEFGVSDDIVIIRDENDVIIDHLVTKERYLLKGMAVEMWDTLLRCGNQEMLFAQLHQEYDVDQVTLQYDVTEFIENLFSRGILREKSEL
jgi:hypothetical protein